MNGTVSIAARVLLSGLVALAMAASASADEALKPGTYEIPGWNAQMRITALGKDAHRFYIESVSNATYICAIGGVVRNGIGVGDSPSPVPEGRCRVSFQSTAAGIRVEPFEEDAKACQGYCGVKGNFDGVYQLPPVNCTEAARKRRRADFQERYRRAAYAPAHAAMESLISECGSYFDWIEMDRLRNDLAITAFHLGHSQECLAILDKTRAVREAAGESEARLGGMMGPAETSLYEPVANATWHNQALCSK